MTGESQAGPKEYKLKAAYLFNFAKYIVWPDSAFDAGGNIAICVMGEDRFDGILAKAINGKTAGGHTIEVKNLPGGAASPSPPECHLVFVSSSEEGNNGNIIASGASSAVALVGEVAGFAQSGGLLNFTSNGAKITIELNMSAAEKAGLKVSGKLQQVATSVSGS